MPFDREQMQEQAASLATQGVYLGTSSWKYEGWIGQLYSVERYAFRGKVAKTRFDRECLREYGEVFKTVCVDAAYYTFPSQQYLERMVEQVPTDFLFGLKVTDAITVKKFPKLDRFGDLAGKPNENFLNADLFVKAFMRPCEAIRPNIGLIIFEFSRFWPTDYDQGRDFVVDLDKFLGQLPNDWPYGVEIRNRNWLCPDYFDCLTRHRVTHVYNSWEAMPPVSEQMAMTGSRTNSSLVAARFLLKPGRRYEEAVKAFQPYDKTREVNAEARKAGADLIADGVKVKGRKTFIYVNNRLEGNAPSTIAAMVEMAELG
jgi:uncharacterized protein YecE (DUF72 family)